MDSRFGGEIDVIERLRGAGLRATAPRVRILGLLEAAGGHHSVDDLITLLGQQGHRISRMSVYNVMADLETAGLIFRADTGPGRALYELGDRWHHHFVCRICRGITDVPCLTGEAPCLTPAAPLHGIVEEAQVIFRGVCESCAGRNESAGSTTG